MSRYADGIENGKFDDYLNDEEWLEDLPDGLMSYVWDRKKMIDPNYALYHNDDDLESFQYNQGQNKPKTWVNMMNDGMIIRKMIQMFTNFV